MMRQPEYDSLTLRQGEIAELLVRGKSTREIALELILSPRTIETHVAAIYNKYGVSSRAELMHAVLGPSSDARARVTLPDAGAAKTNLPVRRGELLGRRPDIENVVRTLRANQLVTLTGAGGIGKTQAAMAVGEALLEEFPAGVCFVELAALAHGSPVAEALAQTLNLQPAKDRPLIDSLVTYLQRTTLLLIVDNCEHVIGEVATLVDALMRSCPRLRILATSREPLRIGGEQRYRLPSLSVPANHDAAGLRATRGAEFSAVQLFTARAQAVDFSFALDDENTPIVADICRRLDGIPLAIELAAARVKVLSLRSLATKIESHLRILAGGDRLALPRHQTMHALIDWSYDLLAPAEQRLFERLSVFAGGCALAEAAIAYGVENDDEFVVLDLLSSLVDKSLLGVDLQSSESRYVMLQSFAQYASEKLESRGEATLVRQRHASAYAALAERLEEEYELAPTAAWYTRAEIDFENFLSALAWSLGAGHDIALGQRLAAAMRPVWANVGRGRRWLQIARELVDERTPPLLAARLEHAAASARSVGHETESVVETSLRLIAVYQELGEPLRAAYAQSLAAFSLNVLGRLAEAESLIAPALEVARSYGRTPLVAFLLRASSHLNGQRGDMNGSREKLVEALAIYERIGADRLATSTVGQLAELEFQLGNFEQACDVGIRCINLQRAQGSRNLAHGLLNSAAYNVALNRWDRARAYACEALGLLQEAQEAIRAIALLHLTAVVVLSAVDEASSPAPMPSSSTLKQGALLLGNHDACMIRFGVARGYTEHQEYDRVLAALRAHVPAAELERYFAQGAALTPEQAIELARSI